MKNTIHVSDQSKFRLRLPDGLRDHIAGVAKANNRSMNSEIIAVLQGHYFLSDQSKIEQLLTELDADALQCSSLGPQHAAPLNAEDLAELRENLKAEVITMLRKIEIIEKAMAAIVARTEQIGEAVKTISNASHRS